MTLWPELETSLVRAADRAADRTRTRQLRSAPRLRQLAIGTAAVAALAVGLSTTAGSPPVASAADLLRAAARAALVQPALFPRDDQFLYQEIEGETLAGLSTRAGHTVNVQERVVTQRWTSADRTGLMRTRIVAVHFPSEAAAAEWRANSPVPRPGQVLSMDRWGPFHGYTVGGRVLSRQQLLALPRDPRALSARLFAHQLRLPAGSERLHQWNTLIDTLVASGLPPWLRSEVFTDLSFVPGVRAASATDLLGRHGAAVEFRYGGLQDTVIFDASTSEILGTRTIALQAGEGFQRGQVVANLAYVDTRVTDNIAAR